MNLAEGLPIDLQTLLETRMLIQANAGGGKSFAIRRLIEQTASSVQQLVIDVEGEFATLREKHDFIICAAHDADAIATPQTASLLALRLLESGVSAVLDIYDLKPHDRQLFVKRFLESLINAPRKLRHSVLIVLDEAHVFCPQAGSTEATPAVIDIAARGRKRGLCLIAATQRLSKLHKDVAAELLNKLIGRTGLDVDVKRAADELGMVAKDALQALRALDPGEFYAFGPALCREPLKVIIGPVATTHPKAGQRLLQAPPPASPKVRAQLAKLADLQKEAEQDARTVEELQAKNADLVRKVEAAERSAKQAGVPEVDVQRRIKAALAEQKAQQITISGPAFDQVAILEIAGHAESITADCAKMLGYSRADLSLLGIAPGHSKAKAAPARVTPQRAPMPAPSAGLSRPEQRILDAIAWMESIGVPEPGQPVVAFLSDYSGPDNSAYKNPRASLNARGHLRYIAGGQIALTDSGRALANTPAKAATTEELHQRVLGKLSGPEQRILSVLLQAYPQPVGYPELAVSSGYSDANNSAFKNPRAKLRTFGLIEYLTGSARAVRILFPEGK